MADERLVNELTGETMTLNDYISANRALERALFRQDNVINDLKSSLKAAREDQKKLVSQLRANAREIRLRSKPTALRGRAATKEAK